MVIIDTGPLVAIFDGSEPGHERCKAALKKLKTAPLTTWPVLTEAFYLLEGWESGQKALWDFIIAGGVVVHDVPDKAYDRLRELMDKYADSPMDLADASLVVTAERHKIKKIFTLDRKDFLFYRPSHCTHFEILP